MIHVPRVPLLADLPSPARRGIVLEALVDAGAALAAGDVADRLREEQLLGSAQDGTAVSPFLRDLAELGYAVRGESGMYVATSAGVELVQTTREAAPA